MKPEEVRKSSAGLLIEEARKHPGAADLVADVELTGESFEAQRCMERMGLFGMALARLEGWLMCHLAEPEKGEAERLLETLGLYDGKIEHYSTFGRWSAYDGNGGVLGQGSSALEALRNAFPEASASPAPVVPAPAPEEQDQKDDDQEGGGAHG